MSQFRSRGITLTPKGKKKNARTKWAWDRTTVYLLVVALAMIAFVVFEVMRSRGPLEP